MTVKAYAKINLILNVLGKRPDGFHDIETVFYALRLCDLVTVEKSDCSKLEISDKGLSLDGVSEEDNIAYKAVCLAKKEYGIADCFTVKLEKHIPDAAGFGGGSADAAAVLTALSEMYSIPKDEKLYGIAAQLGSDVPFCLAAQEGHRAAIGRGRGEILEFIDLPEFEFEFMSGPKIENKTAKVYKELKDEDCKNYYDVEAFLKAKTAEEKIELMGNQLQAPLERITGVNVPDMILCGAGPTYFRAVPKREEL